MKICMTKKLLITTLITEGPIEVIEEKKIRESSKINIIDYLPKHKEAFQELNERWITKYFILEDADRKALDNPKEYILDNGGKILVAVQGKDVLGVCALLKMQGGKYELAKMAVSPKSHGKGIGFLLGKAIIAKAKLLKANNVYLESNTILKPAISLYKKLGFKKVVGYYTPYERCNIQMELILK